MVDTFGPSEVGHKYHLDYPFKHQENSLRGTHWSHAHGFKTSDVDMLPDARLVRAVHMGAPLGDNAIRGHLRACHWLEPLRKDEMHDPKGILHRDDKIIEMEPFEIDRLVAHTRFHGVRRAFHIPTMEEQIALFGELHYQLLMEPKQSMVWMRPEVWVYLAHLCEDHHTKAAVYSLQHECLPYARHAGFNAWPI
jgi:hypothetical protein